MRLILCIFFLLINIVSYGQDTKRTLIIGALPFNTPFSTEVDIRGHFIGFDISFMNEICRRLNFNCIYKRKTITQLFQSLNDQTIDLALGGLIITKERKSVYIFSLPYLMSYGRFIVLSDSQITTIDQLANKRIGVQEDSVYKDLAYRMYGQNAKIVTFILIPDMLSSLVNKNVDAVLIDSDPATYWSSKEENLKVLGQPIKTGSGYAIMSTPMHENLIEDINAVILNMEQDGTYIKIYNDFFN